VLSEKIRILDPKGAGPEYGRRLEGVEGLFIELVRW
jgi:hypothetical protein